MLPHDGGALWAVLLAAAQHGFGWWVVLQGGGSKQP